jgi:phospholipid/cholesterol/gamma-HCH transport system substrate-binding protein
MMHYVHSISQARIHQIVGWFVLVPVVILGAVLVIVGKNENLFEKKYQVTTVFSEGFGVKEGYPVMLLGLQVGRVGSIEFTEQNNAQFTLRILKKYQDKIRANSVATIGKSGGLFGEPQIEITAGNKSEPIVPDGGHIEADEPLDLMAEAKTLLDSVTKTLAKADGIAQEVLATVQTGHAALAHVKEASAGLPEVMDNVRETSRTIKQASRDISKEVPALTASARKSLARVGDVVEDVKSSTAKLPAAVENVKAATEDLKGLMHNDVPPLLQSAQGTMDDVTEILDGAKKTFPISVFAAKGKAARAEADGASAGSGLRSLRADELNRE